MGCLAVSQHFFFGQGRGIDPDAARYIAAVQQADGAGLEGGVKLAINAFVVGCKKDGLWDAIKASCIMAGARTLSGALVPLKGAAPTNNNFISGDYDRMVGLIGNGSTKYLNSNRNNATDPQDNKHAAVYATTRNTEDSARAYVGATTTGSGGDTQFFSSNTALSKLLSRVNNAATVTSIGNLHASNGFLGVSRNTSLTYTARGSGTNETLTATSATPENLNYFIFSRNLGGITDLYSNGRLTFYSIGEYLDLAKLESRLTSLMAAYRAAIADADALAYIAAVEAADGQALEDGVRTAINTFVVGCKVDNIWAAIKSSCILAGARTISGALVPLKGTAPTNNNFVSGDYDRETGLVGNGTSKNLDSNRNNNADPQDNNHNAAYATAFNGNNFNFMGAAEPFGETGANTLGNNASSQCFARNRNGSSTTVTGTFATGLVGISRAAAASYTIRRSASNSTATVTSQTPSNRNVFIYGRVATTYAPCRLAFYSIGESLDLAKLDARVATLITDYGAAI